MKVLQIVWHSRGIMIFDYLDDLLILGPSQSMVATDVASVLRTLNQAGLHINFKNPVLDRV